MNNLQDIILNALKKNNCSIKELSYLTNKPATTIRARVSDLRKRGYKIEMIEETVKKYSLSEKTLDTPEKILKWIDDHRARGQNIKFNIISKQLNIPENEISDGYQKLFKTHQIVQTSNSSAIVL